MNNIIKITNINDFDKKNFIILPNRSLYDIGYKNINVPVYIDNTTVIEKEIKLILILSLLYNDTTYCLYETFFNWDKNQNKLICNKNIYDIIYPKIKKLENTGKSYAIEINYIDGKEKLKSLFDKNISVCLLGMEIDNFIYASKIEPWYIDEINNVFTNHECKRKINFSNVRIASQLDDDPSKFELLKLSEVSPLLFGIYDYDINIFKPGFEQKINESYKLSSQYIKQIKETNDMMIAYDIIPKIKSIVNIKIGNKNIDIIPMKFSHLINKNSPLIITILDTVNNVNNVNYRIIKQFDNYSCYESFIKILKYVYQNKLPKLIELLNLDIIKDICEIIIIIDFLGIDIYDKYLKTIFLYIK